MRPRTGAYYSSRGETTRVFCRLGCHPSHSSPIQVNVKSKFGSPRRESYVPVLGCAIPLDACGIPAQSAPGASCSPRTVFLKNPAHQASGPVVDFAQHLAMIGVIIAVQRDNLVTLARVGACDVCTPVVQGLKHQIRKNTISYCKNVINQTFV